MNQRDKPLFEDRGITTGARATLFLTKAGIGGRSAAYMADWLILVGSWLTLLLAVNYLGVFADLFLPTEKGTEVNRTLLLIMLLSVYFGNWAYFTLFETFWRGQTPGKRITGARVVLDDGLPISFRHAALRSTMRAVDFLPGLYAVGLTVALLNRDGKRLGDLVAGTVLIKENSRMEILEEPAFIAAGEPRPVSAKSREAAKQISDYDLETLRLYLRRRREMEPEARRIVARRVVEAFCAKSKEVAELAEACGASDYPEFFLEDLSAAASFHQNNGGRK